MYIDIKLSQLVCTIYVFILTVPSRSKMGYFDRFYLLMVSDVDSTVNSVLLKLKTKVLSKLYSWRHPMS